MKTVSKIEIPVEVNGKSYALAVPSGTNIKEAYDAAIEIAKNIAEFSNEAAKKAEESKHHPLNEKDAGDE